MPVTASHDLVVIGAGSAGLAAATTSRKRGKVALVEATGRPGGDCTWAGCVPSKALLETARRVAGARAGDDYGFSADVAVDFGAVMKRVHAVMRDIGAGEDAATLTRAGVEVVAGWARFLDPWHVEVGDRVLRGSRFVVAVGSTAAVPPLEGLSDVPYLTNGNIFDLTELPSHLLVLGGGAIGCELAQAFRRLGAQVTVVEALPRIAAKEEPEASAALASVLVREGVTLATGVAVERVSAGPTLHLADGTALTGSHLLVAVGRRPATAGLGLEEAGIVVGPKGEVVVDQHLRTSQRHVFAAGDCATALQFTHVADEQGRLAVGNAFATSRVPGRSGLSSFVTKGIPWATFTEPEIGRVGLTEAEAFREYGEQARVSVVPMTGSDRARCAGETEGFVKLVAVPRRGLGWAGGGRLVGMTAVCPTGGELVAEGALAIRTGAFAGRLAQTVHAYPTWSLTTRMAAAQLFGGSYGGGECRPARPA